MTRDLAWQHGRLAVLRCLRGIADRESHDDTLCFHFEELIEDRCDPVLPEDGFERAVHAFLVDDAERDFVALVLPKLLVVYKAWDFGRPETAPWLRDDYSEIVAACGKAAAAMDRNADAHADAVADQERLESERMKQ